MAAARVVASLSKSAGSSVGGVQSSTTGRTSKTSQNGKARKKKSK